MDSRILEYKKLIDDGDIIVGYYIKLLMDKLVKDMEEGFWVFDNTESEKRIKFIENMALQSKAPYYNKPLVLVPWQKAFIESIYSFKDPITNLRKYQDILLEVARKNGKSTTLAGNALYDLFVGEGGVDICTASNDDGQARLIWEELGGMRGRLDPTKSITSQNRTHIRNDVKNIAVTRMSSKTQNKDGRNYAIAMLDESHDINEPNGNSEIAEALWRSMSTREEPLFINCTTNGFNRGCYLDVKIEHAKRVLRGEIDDERMLPWLFEQDSEAEIWQDEDSWQKANPMLIYGIKKKEKLARDVELAKENTATRVHLLTKDFNLPQNSASSWLLYDQVSYPTPVFTLEDFKDSVCLGFVDLSATTDLTCAVMLLQKPNDNKKYIYSHYWTLQEKLEEIEYNEGSVNYLEWAKKGYITIHDGTEIDLTEVADWYYYNLKKFKIKPLVIGYDQRYAKVFIDRCEEYGFETAMIQQGKPLDGAMKLTEADLRNKKIHFNNNPVDQWCLSNVACKVDNFGNIQPVKMENDLRIDGGICFISVNEVYRRYRAEFEQYINMEVKN